MSLTNNLLQFSEGKATQKEIFDLLLDCDRHFIPFLSTRVNIEEYAAKLFQKAKNFEAWNDNSLIGLISTYFNDQQDEVGFISNVCLRSKYKGQGIAQRLLSNCLAYGRNAGFKRIELEVAQENKVAQDFYNKAGFVILNIDVSNKRMSISL